MNQSSPISQKDLLDLGRSLWLKTSRELLEQRPELSEQLDLLHRLPISSTEKLHFLLSQFEEFSSSESELKSSLAENNGEKICGREQQHRCAIESQSARV